MVCYYIAQIEEYNTILKEGITSPSGLIYVTEYPETLWMNLPCEMILEVNVDPVFLQRGNDNRNPIMMYKKNIPPEDIKVYNQTS